MGRRAERGILLVAICIGVVSVSSAAAATPGFCQGPGPIPASAIGAGVNLNDCPILGEEIQTPSGGGWPPLGVPVPSLNGTNLDVSLTISGEYELEASVDGFGELTVSQASATPVAPPDTSVASATDPACSEGAYNLEGGGVRWPASVTVNWYYNESSVSRSGLSVSATLSDVRQANSNITLGINNCGYAEGVWTSKAQFIGDTSKYANIDSNGKCTSNFPDGQNTVSWGSLPYDTSGTLADTCVHWVSGTITEADTQLGSTSHLVDDLPSSCTDQSDLQSVSTHEWGHAFGLAHETSESDEVMYPDDGPCKQRRHLGKGDYDGMAFNYSG